MGPIFKKYRVDANRTQEEVAEKVGITARFLMALENEEKRPSLDILLRLVDTLNIPGDAILHPQIQHTDSEEQQLLRQYAERLQHHPTAFHLKEFPVLEEFH